MRGYALDVCGVEVVAVGLPLQVLVEGLEGRGDGGFGVSISADDDERGVVHGEERGREVRGASGVGLCMAGTPAPCAVFRRREGFLTAGG